MKFKIMSVVILVASSCVNAADDCYYGFKASPTGGHEGWINNNGTWFVGDVRRLINNNGWLEVGNYSNNNQAKEKFETANPEE